MYRRYPYYKPLGARARGGMRFGYVPNVPAPVVSAATKAPSFFEKLVSAVTPIATTAVSVYQQSRIDRMNRQRLAKGLPAIPPEQYRQYMAPTATAEIGLSPATRNLLIYGGLGLAALLILPRMLRR